MKRERERERERERNQVILLCTDSNIGQRLKKWHSLERAGKTSFEFKKRAISNERTGRVIKE